MSRPGVRPPFTGGAVDLGHDAKALARRIVDGLRRRLGREPSGDDIRAAMGHLDATRSELALDAASRDRGGS